MTIRLPGHGVVTASDTHNDVEYPVVKIAGTSDSGSVRGIAMTGEGHVEVAIHAPRLPFGAVHVEEMLPEFQADAVYGIDAFQEITSTSLSGTSTAANNFFVVSTGTTQYGFGTLQSRQRLRYRPGQGVIARFTGLFSAGVASSLQGIGVGTSEAGAYFGYNGTSFGILHVTGGVRECRTLTITTKSSTTNDITITLNNVVFTVTGITNGANTQQTAYEISKFTFSGWSAEARGSTVIFVSGSAGPLNGTYAISQTGGGAATGTYARTITGVSSTDTWVPQTSWNGDKLDGNGPSGITLDPTKGNVYQIDIQYLGFGSVVFKIETCPEDGNNADFVVVHTMRFPNTRTSANFSNPSFPFTMFAYSAGSTTDVEVKCASYAGFIEGRKYLTGSRFSYSAQSTSVNAAAFRSLQTVKNSLLYNSRVNQSVVRIISVSGAIKHISPVVLYLIRNASLDGAPDFTAHANTSCTSTDTTATTCTFSDNSQLIWSAVLGDTGNIDVLFSDEINLQPGESITLAAKSSSGSPSYVNITINTREDH